MEYRNNLKNIFFSLTISALAEEKAKELETQARYTRYRRNVHELFSLTVEIHPVNANNSLLQRNPSTGRPNIERRKGTVATKISIELNT